MIFLFLAFERNMLLDRLKDIRVVLASQSPRRKELLAALDIDFEVIVKSVDESVPSDISSHQVAESLALKKLSVFDTEEFSSSLVIAADTVVVDSENQVLGKPVSEQAAFEVIKSLSGEPHDVYTGVAMAYAGKRVSFTEKTKVYFDSLTDEEIRYYIAKYKPLDKAGAYGIQEWIGRAAVISIEGSYENVMGLPTVRLYKELKKLIK